MIDGWTPQDPFFGPARVDVDERRVVPAPHRYVHGHFEGTDTRFAAYLPDRYDGRLVQFLQGGMGGNEHQGVNSGVLGLAFVNGAVHCESNQGHVGNDLSGIKGDPSILAHRASRATLDAVTALARAHYGRPPHHRYLYGGSGGGLRAIECVERNPGAWDGVVPFIINRNGLTTYNFSLHAWATFVLADRLDDLVDATDAGGTGDPLAVLDTDLEREALTTLYRAGYCRGSESQLRPSPLWVIGMQIVQRIDPAYFTDFWTVPGHAGTDGDPVAKAMHHSGRATVGQVVRAGDVRGAASDVDDVLASVLGRVPDDAPIGLRLDQPVDLLGATITVETGAEAGRTLLGTGLVDGAQTAVLDPEGVSGIEPGDIISWDNADLVAFAFHHRHLVGDAYPEMAPFLRDGQPVHPQRPLPLAFLPVPTGRFDAKMVLIQHGADRECWPSCARAYESSVRQELGEGAEERFRIWWQETAPHVPPTTADARRRYVTPRGTVARAVRDVIRWVEDGVPPPPSTNATFGDDNALVLPPTAAERAGVQPVVTPASSRVTAGVGEDVGLAVTVTAPVGLVHTVAWDTDGSGTFALATDPDAPAATVTATTTVRFEEAGTHFVAVTASSGDPGGLPLYRVSNLTRIRVVVS